MNTTQDTSATQSASPPGVTQALQFVTSTTERLLGIYRELRYVGYLAVLGALIIFYALVFVKALEFRSQLLFVSVGFGLILIGGGYLALQQILSYRLAVRNDEVARLALQQRHERAVDAGRAAAIEPEKAKFETLTG
jgi:hypothetical protein